jgi:Zn-dependent metalloprotease
MQTDLLQKAKTLYQSIEHFDINNNNGTPRAMRGTLAINVNISDLTQAKQFLQNSKSLFRINNATDDFTMRKVSRDKLNMTHARFQQTYKGVPVWGSELILHSDVSNTVTAVNGRFTPDLNLDVTPSILSDNAMGIALTDLGPADYRWQKEEQEKLRRSGENLPPS